MLVFLYKEKYERLLPSKSLQPVFSVSQILDQYVLTVIIIIR